MNDDFDFDINDYFYEFSKKIKLRSFPKSSEDDCFLIKSLNVKISNYPEIIKKEVETAIRGLELSLQALIFSGINLRIEEIHWHNVKDSCENIMGNTGCFIVKYRKI